MMLDMMFKATDKAAWDAFAATLPEGILIDEIGVIDAQPSVVCEDGTVLTLSVAGSAHHVNVRVLRPSTSWTDDDGVQHMGGVDCAALAQGATGVQWIDPATVETPARIWAGGMNYFRF